MSPASPLAAQLTRLPVRLTGSGDGHQRERIAASCAAVKIGRGLTIAARRAAMKARIHRTRSAQAAKREARSEKRTVPPRPWGYDWGYLSLCRY